MIPFSHGDDSFVLILFKLRERRFKSALLPYQNILEMKTICSVVSSFLMEVVSEDEREMLDGNEHYLVIRLDWRSPGGDNLCKILDALHMASHFTADDRPCPGQFSHPRTPSRRLYMEFAPPGLPSNLYKPEYLEGLTPDELDALNVQPEVAFLFPARAMRFALLLCCTHHLTSKPGLLHTSAI